MQRVVSVWTRWGDYVLGVRDVRPGESLSVGAQPLLRFRSGTANVRTEPDGAERELQVGESLTVTVGELDYTLCCSEPTEAATFAPSRRPWALLDATVLSVLLAASLWQPAVRVLSSGIGVLAELGRFASPVPAEEQPPVHEPLFAVVAAPEAERLRLPGDMRCGRAEMGGYVSEPDGRYGVAGPADNADPHLARPVPGLGQQRWFDGNLSDPTLVDPKPPRARPGSSAPTAPFGRDTALATDPKNALGDMWGEELSDAWGENGLGLAGRPGGVVKRFDVAPLADHHAGQLRVVHTDLRVIGARKPSEIGRVMAARFADFRACGEAVEPAALHDVELGFQVDEAGHAVANGTGAGALEQCLEQSLASASFAAGASAVSRVVYPLHFVATNVELKGPPMVPPSGAAPCGCGG